MKRYPLQRVSLVACVLCVHNARETGRARADRILRDRQAAVAVRLQGGVLHARRVLRADAPHPATLQPEEGGPREGAAQVRRALPARGPRRRRLGERLASHEFAPDVRCLRGAKGILFLCALDVRHMESKVETRGGAVGEGSGKVIGGRRARTVWCRWNCVIAVLLISRSPRYFLEISVWFLGTGRTRTSPNPGRERW